MKNLKVNVILSLVALSLAALVLPQPAAGASADYIYRTILPTGYQSASFESLNESGVLVGQCKDRAGVEWGFIYYLFTGKFTFIKPDGWKWAAATSINESGVVVGSGMDGSATLKGFIYDPDTGDYTELLPPGWAEARATHINDTGTVVGYGKKAAADTSFTSLIYAAGTYSEITLPDLTNVQATAINNNGMMVGMATSDYGDRGFLYDSGTDELTIMDPGGWTWTGALNINQWDEVVGWGEDGSGNRLGYLYSEGDYTELSHATLPYTVANDVSDSGLVVGTFNDNSGYTGCIGFIFDTSSYIELNPDPSWYILAPRVVSSRGVVVGWCLETEEGPEKAFVAIPPEATRVALELTDKDAFARNYEAYQRALDGVTPDASFIAESVLKLLKW